MTLNVKSYVAKSIAGAQRRVRELQKQVDERNALLDQWARERQMLAMLAAETPQFYNPLVAMEAKEMRDCILAEQTKPLCDIVRVAIAQQKA